MKYSIKKITFENWTEYLAKTNDLLKEGFKIDETLEKEDFGREIGKVHTVRFKKKN